MLFVTVCDIFCTDNHLQLSSCPPLAHKFNKPRLPVAHSSDAAGENKAAMPLVLNVFYVLFSLLSY